jgi:hypothetical protein
VSSGVIDSRGDDVSPLLRVRRNVRVRTSKTPRGASLDPFR